ncbi:hypothetical protein KPO98_004095 [Salmonella enterica]|nr:hypothetical protein [Salmonella enterica]
MMMHNSDPYVKAEHIILHGDCWPVVSAVESMVKSVFPECRCSTASDLPMLISLLTCNPGAALILCLRPREHLFLFYVLREDIYRHPTLVISDEIFFCDRVLLRSLGDISCMRYQELELMITSKQLFPVGIGQCPEKSTLTNFLLSPSLPSGLPEVIPDFSLEEPLMEYLSLMIYREMDGLGITPFRMRLLQYMYAGHQSYEELAKLMNVSPKKIWNEKYQLLKQTDMSTRLREIIYGTRFCFFLQRTPFISPPSVHALRGENSGKETPYRSRYICKPPIRDVG